MKHTLTALIWCLALTAAATVSAQDAEWRQGGRLLYVSGGTTSREVGDTGGMLDLGSGFGAEYVATARFSEMFGAQFTVGATVQDLTVVGEETCCGSSIDGDRVWLFPLTAMGQFHIPVYGPWDPYLGVGAAWTVPYYKISTDLENSGVADVDFKGQLGFAAQAGFNYTLDNRWFVNLDVRYLGVSLEAEVSLEDGEIDTVDLDTKPWLVGFGFGYRF